MRGVSVTAIAAFVAVFAAQPAEAAPVWEPWERVGQWNIWNPNRGVCAANREYPGLTRVSFLIATRRRYLSVSNPNWPEVAPAPYRMRLITDGESIGIAPVEEGRAYNDGRRVEVGPDFASRFAAADAIEIDRADGGPAERLELGGVAAAVARLPACVAGSPRSRTASRAGQSVAEGKAQLARARTNLSDYFSSNDYPAAALRAREEGEVRFRLQVDGTGRVSSCAITSSSGSQALDSTTCSLIVRRARFTPARDDSGRPVPDSVSGSIVWVLPASRRAPPRP